MDRINIVSSQAVLKVSSFSMDTRSVTSSALVNSLVKIGLFNTAPDIDEPPFQFIRTMDLSVVDTMLHDSPNLLIHKIEIWAVWRSQVGRKKVWRFLTQQFNCCTCAARCAGALSWWNKVVTRDSAYRGSSMTSLWRREAASKKSARDITIISCFVTTMNLLHALQIYSTVFVKKCRPYAVALFKVVQQQTTGKVQNSIIYLWANNFVCNGERMIDIGQYLRKLYSNEKGGSFFYSKCISHVLESAVYWWMCTNIFRHHR